MGEGYLAVMGRQLFVWAGWVFTVGGAIGSFALGGNYAWIGWLVVFVGVLALTGHSYSVHQRCRQLEAENGNLTRQKQEADQKLNEVPLDLLNRIREFVTPRSLSDVASELAAHADYVLRIQKFMAALEGEIHLRTFRKRDNAIYALAKIEESAVVHLRENDVFVLVRSSEGLRTDCALMVVHQTPDASRDVVHFRLLDLLSDDARALEQMTTAREVTGLTGYTLRPSCDAGWYDSLETSTIPEAIERLARGLERERRANP